MKTILFKIPLIFAPGAAAITWRGKAVMKSWTSALKYHTAADPELDSTAHCRESFGLVRVSQQRQIAQRLTGRGRVTGSLVDFDAASALHEGPEGRFAGHQVKQHVVMDGLGHAAVSGLTSAARYFQIAREVLVAQFAAKQSACCWRNKRPPRGRT